MLSFSLSLWAKIRKCLLLLRWPVVLYLIADTNGDRPTLSKLAGELIMPRGSSQLGSRARGIAQSDKGQWR